MGAVGFTMLITVLAMQWGILVDGFFGKWYNNEWGFIEVDMLKLIESLFLVASILISYGAVIGKVSPLQLVVMTFFEVIFYSINKSVLVWGVVDLVDGRIFSNVTHIFSRRNCQHSHVRSIFWSCSCLHDWKTHCFHRSRRRPYC